MDSAFNVRTSPEPWHMRVFPHHLGAQLVDEKGDVIADFSDARDAEKVLNMFELVLEQEERIESLESELEQAPRYETPRHLVEPPSD